MAELAIELLGAQRILIDGSALEVGARKAEALLAYLAVEGQPARRDSLAALFWPDHDQTRARAYLRNALWTLSQAGLEAWIESGRETVSLRPGYRLDAAEFRALLAEGGDAVLERAATLYRGDFMAGFSLPDCPDFDSWQYYQSETLRKELAGALDRLAESFAGAGRWEEAIRHARRRAAVDPLDETAQRALVRLYASSGERALALKQYETLRETLDRELGITPDAESRALYQEILTQPARKGSAPQVAPASLGGLAAPERVLDNLPAELTSFVGRERQIAEITELLRPNGGPPKTRLLTLTGPGGSGKTRLALRCAAGLRGAFADGVFFVGLAPVDRPEHVPGAIARALRLAEMPGRALPETLKDSLGARNLLLVLDNFEHLMPAAPLVAELLAAAPGLAVLATSREVLRISGEQVYPVPPLAVPPLTPARTGAHDLLQYESVRLFFERARAVDPNFDCGETEAERIAEICARLDGLPLAIELAAARLRLFSLDALRGQISQALAILRGGPRDAPARQQTLRATIDWSYRLLDPSEQRLFARLGAFHGGCTLAAFEQVCDPDGSLNGLDGLQSLIEKSLVVPVKGRDGEPRYIMLETIGAYAREKLAEQGETEATTARHARFFAGLADEADADLRGGPKLLYWLQRLESDHGNLRGALDWSLGGGDPLLGMQMAAALMLFWVRQDHQSEGRGYVERALALSDGAPVAVRAKLHYCTGFLAYFRQDLTTCLEGYRQAVRLYREVGDPGWLGWLLVFEGAITGMVEPDRYSEALALCDEGMAMLHRLGDRPRIAQALNIIGEMARTVGDYDKAREVYDECLAISRETGDLLRELMMYQNLGFVAMRVGDYAHAEALFHPAMGLAQQIGSVSQYILMFQSLAGLCAARGELEKGARMMGAAEAMLELHNLVLQPADRFEVDFYQANLRAQMRAEDYAAAYAEGRALSLEEAVALARG